MYKDKRIDEAYRRYYEAEDELSLVNRKLYPLLNPREHARYRMYLNGNYIGASCNVAQAQELLATRRRLERRLAALKGWIARRLNGAES